MKKSPDNIGEEIEELERENARMSFECVLSEQELAATKQRILSATLMVDRTIFGENERKKAESTFTKMHEKASALEDELKSSGARIAAYGEKLRYYARRTKRKSDAPPELFRMRSSILPSC